jgi:tRNA (guanosine-2'-O-)-methyltransferase
MTPQRLARLKQILDRRQPDLTVLLDNVHKPHNLSAIMRNCDAVGVHEIHAITRTTRFKPHKLMASGSGNWVKTRTHPALASAVAMLKDRGMQILAAHPGEAAVDFREMDYTRPTAILLGQELQGLDEASLALADAQVQIPMLGAVASLNVSVAAALILFEAQRQRLAAGLYDHPRLDATEYALTLFEWAQPKLAAFYRQRDLPYPPLGEDGEVLEEPAHIQARLGADRPCE